MKLPFERECMYCGAYFTPSSSKQTHCKHTCSQRHYKERAKRRRLTEQGFEGVFPLELIPNRPFYTPTETANILAVSKPAVSKWIKEGKINHLEIEGYIRIPHEEINRFIKIKEDDNNN